MKINPSVKVALVASGVALAAYVGYQAFAVIQLMGYEPKPVVPGKVTLVAFKTDSNLRIRVANQVAQLVEVSGDGQQRSASTADASDARRIPIKEFLLSLEGDSDAAGEFITTINKIDQTKIVPGMTVWQEEDIKKAIAGDQELLTKLEEDLHISLDGTPPKDIRLKSLRSGIVIESTVPLNVNINGKQTTINAPIKDFFQSRFATQFNDELAMVFEPSTSKIAGTYEQIALPLLKGEKPKEDVKEGLEILISQSRKNRLAVKPERLLQGAKVLAADAMFTDAKWSSYKDDREVDQYTLTLGVTDDARKSLWQYSRGTKGFELLLVVDGVAVAAPRITTELSGKEIQIKGLTDEGLVRRTQETVQSVTKPGSKS